jgi:predicted HicB family RNase H-like nuclease
MLIYKGYLGKVEYDDEARLLHGEVVGIRDVVTFQADSASEIKRRLLNRLMTIWHSAKRAERSLRSLPPGNLWYECDPNCIANSPCWLKTKRRV